MFEIGEIERQITQLWRSSGEGEEAAVRACTLNLVVPCEEASEVGNAVALLSEHHPCRAIVVSCGSASGSGELRAWVSAHCHRGLGGRKTCSEQVTIEAHGDAQALVPDTVLQLLCEDLPVYLWWRRATGSDDPLLQALAPLSNRVLIDSSLQGDPVKALATLVSSSSERVLGGRIEDLAWTRIEPWRGIVASLFDAPSTRPLLGATRKLRIRAGGPASNREATIAGAYLAGWLASRLAFRIEGKRILGAHGREVEIRLERDPARGPGEIGSVEIDCSGDGGVAQVHASRIEGSSDLVRAWIETERSRPLPRVLKLPLPDDAALLSREIEKETGDPLFGSALFLASKLLASIS